MKTKLLIKARKKVNIRKLPPCVSDKKKFFFIVISPYNTSGIMNYNDAIDLSRKAILNYARFKMKEKGLRS